MDKKTIETRNGYLLCDPFQVVEEGKVETTGFKARDEKASWMRTTIVYSDGDDDLPPGATVWAFNKDRIEQKAKINGRDLVLVHKTDVVFVELPYRHPDAIGPCGSRYHSAFIRCPYCPEK